MDSGKINLSDIGIIAKNCWMDIPNHSSFVELSEFVIMPNHLHGIITINKQTYDPHLINNNNLAIDVETRHALSLQSKLKSQLQSESESIPRTPGEKRFQNQGRNTISSIIGGYKSAVTRNVHLMNLGFEWQRRFWDHVIRDEEEFERIKKYIILNPDNWNNDDIF